MRLLLALFLLGTAAAVGIHAYFTPERLRKIATDAARAALSSEVTIGRVALSPGGANIYDISVARKGGFKAGTQAKVARLSARMSLAQLLRGRLAIRSLAVDGLELDLEHGAPPRKPDTKAAQKAIESSGKGIKLEIKVDEIEVRSGSIRYTDTVSSATLKVSGFTLFADHISDPKPTLLKFGGNFEMNTASASLRGPLSGKVEIDDSSKPAKITPLECSSPRIEGSFSSGEGTLSVSLENLSANRQEDGRLQISAKTSAEAEKNAWKAQLSADASLFLIVASTPGFSLVKAENSILTGLTAEVSGKDGRVSARITDATLRIQELYPSGKFAAEGSGDTNFSLPSLSTGAAFSFGAEGDWTENGYRLNLSSLDLNSGRLALALSAAVDVGQPIRADIRLRTETFRSHDLRFVWQKAPYNLPMPQTSLAGTLEYDGNSVNFSSATFLAGPLAASGKFQLDTDSGRYKTTADLALSLPPLSGKNLRRISSGLPSGNIPQTSMSASISQENARFDWNKILLKIGAAEIKGSVSGRKTGSGRWAWKTVIGGQKMQLADLLSPVSAVSELGITGMASGGGSVSYDGGRALAKMDVNISRATLSWDSIRLRELKGRIRMDKGTIYSEKLEGLAGKTPIAASFKVALSTGNTTLSLKTDIETLDMSGPEEQKKKHPREKSRNSLIDLNLDIRAKNFRHNKVDGKNVVLRCALRNAGGNMEKLSGKAVIKSEGGRLLMLEKSDSNAFLRVVALPFTILQKITKPFKLLPDLSNTTYSQLEGEYTFTNGVMRVDKTELQTGGGEITASGTIDLARNMLNLKIEYKLKGMITRLTTGPITVEVSGPVDNPVVKTGMLSMLNNPIIDNTVGATLRGGKKLLEKIIP